MVIAGSLLVAARGAEAQISDTAPPHLVTISFTPVFVDVTSGAQTVTVTSTVTDDLSGTTLCGVRFVSPSGRQSEPLFFTGLPRISGTTLNGVYRGTVTMPQFSETGVWKLYVFMQDSAGNTSQLNPANLTSLGLPTDFAVTSVPDTHPPIVTSLSITPPTIDVSNEPQNVTFDFGLADDIAGNDFTPDRFVEFRVYLYSPTTKQQQFLSRPDFTLISGDAINGVWRATRSFPRYSEAGIWSVAFVQVVDFAGNTRFYSPADLHNFGLSTSFTVVSSLSDTTPPQIVGVTFTPAVIDTSAGSRTVAVTLNVTDDLAGTDFSSDTIGATFTHGIQFTSPSGGQSRTVCCGSFTLSAGTPLNGTWTASVFFPRFSEGGTWKASLLSIQDSVHNGTSLSNAQLVSAGLQNQLVIFQPSQVPDGNVGAAGGTVSDSVFGARAALTFPPGSVGGATDVAIDVLSSSLNLPTPHGFSGGTLFVNVDINPVPAMPFAAPGITVTLPIATFKAPGTGMRLYRLDPASGQLVPAQKVTGAPATGIVNPDGLSATFNGVAHLSTLVGFFPTGEPGDIDGNGVVDCADMAIVKASFGKRTGQLGFDPRADLNGNGVVDVTDLAVVSRLLPAGTVCR